VRFFNPGNFRRTPAPGPNPEVGGPEPGPGRVLDRRSEAVRGAVAWQRKDRRAGAVDDQRCENGDGRSEARKWRKLPRLQETRCGQRGCERGSVEAAGRSGGRLLIAGRQLDGVLLPPIQYPRSLGVGRVGAVSQKDRQE